MNQNLNLENFWNEMEKNYPDAFKHFSQWIDIYKKEVEWKKLFNEDTISDDYREAPKFHELPLEMQIGILFRYEYEMHQIMYYDQANPDEVIPTDQSISHFRNHFMELNRFLNSSQKK